MSSEEWFDMSLARPESGALIELKSGGTLYLHQIHPAANSVGLLWRYTGIARQAGFGKPSFPAYGCMASYGNLLGQ